LSSLERSYRTLVARPALGLAAILGLALAIRLLALFASEPTLPAGDEWDYFRRAVNLARGKVSGDPTGRAPGVILLYAGLFELFHPWAFLAKAMNTLLGSLLVLPVYVLGRSFGGERVGLLAALLVAVYPPFVAFSHFLWAEPLYMLLLVSAMSLLVWDLERPALWKLGAAGVVFGLSALCKESGALFPLVAAGWLLARERADGWGAALRAGAVVAAFALTLLPRVIQINEPGAPLALITRTTSMNLYVGNNPFGAGTAMEHYAELSPNRVEAEAQARALALQYIHNRMPWWPFEKIAKQVPNFFTPNNFAIRRLLMPAGDPGNWGYRFRWEIGQRRELRVAAVVACVIAYLTVTLTGVAGLILSRRRAVSALFMLFIASQIVPSIITFSMSRFRLPSMLFFAIGSAGIMLLGPGPGGDWAAASPRRRMLAAGSCALVGILIAMGYESVLRSTGR
jgi:4-amino-4-deoxy-L-arabinose transferase-like glycosyltransferase